MFAYFSAYSARTWRRMYPHTPTIEEVHKKASHGPQDMYQEPEFIIFDAPLHLKMAVLGNYYGMYELVTYAIRQFQETMNPLFEGQGEKALETLEELCEEVDNLDDSQLEQILSVFTKTKEIVYKEEETRARLSRLVEYWPVSEEVHLVQAKPVDVTKIEPWDTAGATNDDGVVW
jgi:hypothetical protein